MKFLTMVALAACLGLLAGCGQKSGVDTSRLEASFSANDAAGRNDAQAAVNHIQAGKYDDALVKLQKIASEPKLTPDQQAAVKDAMEQLQKQLSAKIDEAAQKINQAAEDLKKKLPLGGK